MTQNASPAGLEPAASLTSVRVKRRKPPLAHSGKRGDLTAENGSAAPEAKVEGPVIVLPPPPPKLVQIEPPPKLAEIEPPPKLAQIEPPPKPAEIEPPESAPLLEPPPELLPLAELLAPLPAEEPEEPEPASPEFLALTPLMPQLLPQLPEREAGPANDVFPELGEYPEYPELLEGEPLELLPAPHDGAEPVPEAHDATADIAAPAPPEPPPAPILLGPPPAEEPPAAASEPESAADLVDYWDSLRGGRDFPALDELDRGHVADTWPNTVLLAIDVADLPRITRLGESDGEIEYTATVIDWIISRGRNAAKRGEPIEEERRFPVSSGNHRYRLLLLPFSSYGLKCDHVLGQLSRAEEIGAVASFKRWLAG
ncbi:MAG TPA: hypothetical protein VE397_09460 [Stellaceae bacterium]|nr:hypothetical protein [Stellaceae bacterium]